MTARRTFYRAATNSTTHHVTGYDGSHHGPSTIVLEQYLDLGVMEDLRHLLGYRQAQKLGVTDSASVRNLEGW